MFSNQIAKIFFLLFTVVLVSTTIVVRETITSVSGLSPTMSHTYLTSSSPQNNIPSNLTSTFKITDEIKHRINALLDSNRTNAAIVIGIVDPNGTQFYSTGKFSKANNSTVNQNTIFAIGSNTKVFTTTLLADMVQDGLILIQLTNIFLLTLKCLSTTDTRLPLKTWLPILQAYRNFLPTTAPVFLK